MAHSWVNKRKSLPVRKRSETSLAYTYTVLAAEATDG